MNIRKNLFTGLFTVFTLTKAFSQENASVSSSAFGSWVPLSIGARVSAPETTTGPTWYWKTTPGFLRTALFDYFYLTKDPQKKIAEDYGKIDFTITKAGVAWIIANTRGNIESLKAGGWVRKLSGIQTEEGYESFGKNKSIHNWVLLERQCAAGEHFSLRTETYEAPVLVRFRPPQMSAIKYRYGVVIEAVANIGRYKLQSSVDLARWNDEWEINIASTNPYLLTGSGFTPESKFYRLIYK